MLIAGRSRQPYGRSAYITYAAIASEMARPSAGEEDPAMGGNAENRKETVRARSRITDLRGLGISRLDNSLQHSAARMALAPQSAGDSGTVITLWLGLWPGDLVDLRVEMQSLDWPGWRASRPNQKSEVNGPAGYGSHPVERVVPNALGAS